MPQDDALEADGLEGNPAAPDSTLDPTVAQALPAQAQAPARAEAAAPSSGGTVALTSPWDQRIYPVPVSRQAEYEKAGWWAPSTGVDEHEVHSTVNNWQPMGAAEAALWSTSQGFVGLPWLVEHAAPEEFGKYYAEKLQQAESEHPYVNLAGRLAGNVAEGMLLAPVAAAGAARLGLGAAEAAAGAAGATGAADAALGTEAVAGGVDAAMGAGETAASAAAGDAVPTLAQQAKAALPGLAEAGLKGAAWNMGIGVVTRYDEAAIQHAVSPEGQEKLVWTLSDVGQDLAVGAVLGGGIHGGLKAVGALGRKLEGVTLENLEDALLTKTGKEQVENQGRTAELRKILKTVLPMGAERGRVYIDNVLGKAEKDMNQLKFSIEGKGNFLKQEEVAQLKALVNEQLAGTKEGADVIKLIEDASGETDLAKTFAPGDMARAADLKKHHASKAAREAFIKNQNESNAYNRQLHQQTAADEARLAGHYDRMGAAQDAADSANIQSQAEHDRLIREVHSDNNRSGKMSPQVYEATMGRKPPPGYYNDPVHVEPGSAPPPPWKPGPSQVYGEPPSIFEMRPDEHYQQLNEEHFRTTAKGDPANVLTPQRLQEIRQKIYDMINFKAAGTTEARAVDAKLEQTGKIFGDQIKKIFANADTSAGKQMESQWQLLDETYSTTQLLKSAFTQQKDPIGVAQAIGKVMSSAGMGFAAGSMGFMGGSMAAARAGAGFKAMQTIKPIHFVEAGRVFGQIFGKADKLLTESIVRNLKGSHLRAVPATVTNWYSPAKYQEMAGKVALSAADPAASAARTQEGLLKAGVPEGIAMTVTGATQARNMDLADKMQSQTGPADMATRAHGDPVVQRRIAGQARTMASPIHGLDNPTQANLDVLKKHYPHLLLTAQLAVYSQVRKNPNLSPAAKQWASRILGRPVNNLSSPSFYDALTQSRQQTAQQQAQAGHGTGGKKRVQSGDDTGSGTRFDRLQGGD